MKQIGDKINEDIALGRNETMVFIVSTYKGAPKYK